MPAMGSKDTQVRALAGTWPATAKDVKAEAMKEGWRRGACYILGCMFQIEGGCSMTEADGIVRRTREGLSEAMLDPQTMAHGLALPTKARPRTDIERLKADIRAAIGRDDWETIDRLIGVKRLKMTPMTVYEAMRPKHKNQKFKPPKKGK